MPDRRRHFRCTFDSLEYLQVSANNGGFLLDLSEGGLSAQLSHPADQLDTFQFTLFLGQDSRIDATGQIAWRNPTGTVVGLRFLELSPDFRQLIRQRIYPAMFGGERRPRAPDIILDERIAASEASENAASEPRPKPHVAGPKLVVPPAAPPAAPPPGISARSRLSPPHFGLEDVPPEDRFVPFSAALAAAPPVVPQRTEPALGSFRAEQERRTPLSNRFWIGSASILIVILVLVARLLFHGAPPPPPARTGSPSPSIAQHEPAAPAAPAPKGTGSPVNDPAEQAYLEGMRSLQGAGGSQDTAAAASSFWDAVTKGSIPAEVALARLYLQGEGVSRNCDQATILLEAAARKGNTDAIELLKSLTLNPCS